MDVNLPSNVLRWRSSDYSGIVVLDVGISCLTMCGGRPPLNVDGDYACLRRRGTPGPARGGVG